MARSRDSSEQDKVLDILQRETLKFHCFQNSHLTRLHGKCPEGPCCGCRGCCGSWEGEALLVTRVIGAEARGGALAGGGLKG